MSIYLLLLFILHIYQLVYLFGEKYPKNGNAVDFSV